MDLLVLWSLLVHCLHRATADPSIISTPLGPVQVYRVYLQCIIITLCCVQGREGSTNHGLSTLEYLGIPYAQPPVGTRRFLPPVPVTPWEDLYNATGKTEYKHFLQNLEKDAGK